MEKINPEKAAHNVATVFCEKFLSTSSTASYLDPNSNEFYDKAAKAAQIYALAYDIAFETISSENNEN